MTRQLLTAARLKKILFNEHRALSRHPHNTGIRQQIALEAARLLACQEARGPQDARQKAASRLGCRDRAKWPDNQDIEQALQDYQRLFQAHRQPLDLQRLRRRALEAMENLQAFSPRLVGAVLRGTADHDTPVRLHIYADSPEQVILHLLDQRIPFDERTIQLQYGDRSRQHHPLLEFDAGGATIELVILSPARRSTPPVDPWSKRPDRGAGLSQVESLLLETK